MSRMLPDGIHPDVRCAAERRLFELFRSAEGSEAWICLHSLGLGRHEYQRAGEIDFLLITNCGIFVLEVKGGGIARKDGRWAFINRYNERFETSRGPFEQARSAMFTLERRLREHFGHGSRIGRLLMGYGVMAPDCRLRAQISQCEGTENPSLVYDADDCPSPLSRFVDRLTQATRTVQTIPRLAPNDEDRATVVQFLRGNFDAVIPLSVQAESVYERIQALEPAQYAVLDAIREEPRLVIQGGAGTGKTILALENARRAAWEGRRVLLLCYNRLLRGWLHDRVRDITGPGRIEVRTVPGHLHQLIQRSSLRPEFEKRFAAAANDGERFQRLIPEYGALAALENDPDHEFLIMDEAQDMLTHPVVDALDACLEGGLARGHWRIFLDSNDQAAVYGQFDREALARVHFAGRQMVLTLNCRNSKEIAIETRMLTRPRAFAPSHIDGGPVRYEWYNDQAGHTNALRRLLDSLTGDHGLRPGQITILSPHATPDWLGDLRAVLDCPLRYLDEDDARLLMARRLTSLSFCPVSGFKGLENDIIVLTDIADVDKDWARAVLYVGMSRARTQLFMVLPVKLKTAYKRLVREWMVALQNTPQRGIMTK